MTDEELRKFHEKYFFAGWKGNAKWILDACEALAKIQSSLTEDEFLDVAVGLFDKRNIQRLVRIGTDYRFHDPEIRSKLPNSYGTIDQLCALSETAFYELVDLDLLDPSLKRIEVEEFARGAGKLHARYLTKKGLGSSTSYQTSDSSHSNSSSKSSLKEFASKLELNLSEPKSDKK